MKINETRRRSLLKAVSFRVIEIAFDFCVLVWFVELHQAIWMAILFESVCMGLDYLKERGWNKSNYGREIV